MTEQRMTPIKAALYARVSTADKGQDVENQLFELREYAKRRGFEIAGEYADTGVSGSKETRPQLDRLTRDVRLAMVNVVIVWRFDRFSRSVSHLIRSLEEFTSLQVGFISLTEAIDTSTAVGKMVLTILGAVAELERSIIRERTIAGQQRARRAGRLPGRKPRIFDRHKARELHEQGQSLRQIARAVGVDKMTVYKFLKSS